MGDGLALGAVRVARGGGDDAALRSSHYATAKSARAPRIIKIYISLQLLEVEADVGTKEPDVVTVRIYLYFTGNKFLVLNDTLFIRDVQESEELMFSCLTENQITKETDISNTATVHVLGE